MRADVPGPRTPLRLLLVEDSDDDAELLLLELARGGFDVSFTRVQTSGAMRDALANREWDIVISDYSMPEFTALGALSTLHASGVDIPLIVMSGSVDQDIASEAIRAGACDFVVKSQIARLIPVITNELRGTGGPHREPVKSAEGDVQRETPIANDPLRRKSSARTTSSKPAVLLVDDIEANLVSLEALLADVDCELVRAQGGNAALRHLLKRDFAVILLDVQMPGMDGYEVARYARENPITREIPIIFLTAMSDAGEAAHRAYGTGAVDFLLKPLNPYVLRAKVRVFLDLYLSRRTLADEVIAHEKTLDALERANAALRHFTHAASHDLRAPLRSIGGFLAALRERIDEHMDAESHEYMSRALSASKRMASLLNSLLVYAGLQRPTAHEPVDCGKLLERVRSDLADRLAESNATLEVKELPVVLGDPDRLYQLFLNLISNANKFRRPGESPHIVVAVEKIRNERTFSVKDDGIGLDREQAASIFEAFRRLHGQDVYEGSGLGLAICRQIVEQHGGRIWVESETGRGAKFLFTISPSPS